MKSIGPVVLTLVGLVLGWIALATDDPTYHVEAATEPPDQVPYALSGDVPTGCTVRALEVDGICCGGCTGKLFVDQVTMELRKYVDLDGRPGGDHLFLVNGTRCEYVDCRDAPLPYFARLAADVRDRTETAMPQDHAFRVTELALQAQAQATRLGNLT